MSKLTHYHCYCFVRFREWCDKGHVHLDMDKVRVVRMGIAMGLNKIGERLIRIERVDAPPENGYSQLVPAAEDREYVYAWLMTLLDENGWLPERNYSAKWLESNTFMGEQGWIDLLGSKRKKI